MSAFSENKSLPRFFGLFWLIVFFIYLPAAEAGRVGDFPGWVHFLRSVNFIDYLNRSESGIPSMYQFTQLVTYLFFLAFGSDAWLWHLLFVTLHALNALLLFAFFRGLLADSGVTRAHMVALFGTILFCVSPHMSEVVVWEPAFHYLLGLLLMLAVLNYTRKFLLTGRTRLAWWSGIVFFLSSYSLEVFYLTPLFVLTLLVFYRYVLKFNVAVFRKGLMYFLLPQCAFFALNLVLLHAMYHEGVAHITSGSLHMDLFTFSKAIKYLFHIIFLGRYFPLDFRTMVYRACETRWALSAFYGLFATIVFIIAARFRKFTSQGKVTVLIFSWVVLGIGLIMPLWLPEDRLVMYDRYLYVPCAFAYIFLALLAGNAFNKYLFITVFGIYTVINLRFTHKVVAYWHQSAHIVNNLVYTFPNDPSKKILLLNLPECLDGVQMIGSRTEGEFGMMYDALMPHHLTNPVFDVEAFYMRSPEDGANVTVVNDSTARVTLNQWGTWWLYYGFGAGSYDSKDGAFRVDMKDDGRYYDVILRRSPREYRLLFVVGDQWKIVDWNKKNVVQE